MLDSLEDAETCTIYGIGPKGGRRQYVGQCPTANVERELRELIRYDEVRGHVVVGDERVVGLLAVDDMGREVAYRSI